MLQLDSYATLVAATLVLLLGRLLVTRVGLLRTFNIPKPVAGGLVVALVLLLLRSTLQMELQFDTSLQTPLMLAFFASIGLSADPPASSAAARRCSPSCWWSPVCYWCKTAWAWVWRPCSVWIPTWGCWPVPSPSRRPRHRGGLGRHLHREVRVQSAAELAIACATFGLVLGGLIGGPVARYLVKR